jgi:hypothetical protein
MKCIVGFCSAIIEHTNQVIFMEDDDLAVVNNGALTIHRTQHEVTGQSAIREIIELKIELQEIMKGTRPMRKHQRAMLFVTFDIVLSISIRVCTCLVHVRQLSIFHAKGNLRTAGVRCQYDAWPCQFHDKKSRSWRHQRLHWRNSSLPSFNSHCLRHKLSFGCCHKTTTRRTIGIACHG